jgi:hypothetical protein
MAECPLLAVDSTGRRNTSISFFLLGFECQGLAHTASDPKVPGFSAAVKSQKNSRRFVVHALFPLKDRECCVDRLNRQHLADIPNCRSMSAFGGKADIAIEGRNVCF